MSPSTKPHVVMRSIHWWCMVYCTTWQLLLTLGPRCTWSYLKSHAWLACTYLWDRLKTLHRLRFDAIGWLPHVNLGEGGGSRRLHARSFNLIEKAPDTDLDKGIHCNNSFHFLVWHVIELQAGMYLQQVPPAGCSHNCFLTVLSQPGKPEVGSDTAATFRPHTQDFPFCQKVFFLQSHLLMFGEHSLMCEAHVW